MAKAKTFDICEVHKADYVTPKTPVIVEMKPARYLAIVGQGEPGRKGFQAKVGALYNLAVTGKMAKKSAGQDYTISKLKGPWWGSAT